MMDLHSRNCHFYEKRDKEMEFSVSCLSTHKVSIQVLQDLLQLHRFAYLQRYRRFWMSCCVL